MTPEMRDMVSHDLTDAAAVQGSHPQDHDAHADQHSADDACAAALMQVHAFLHQELPVNEADLIRAHLDACEKCLADFDIEAAISAMLRRSCQSTAPQSLRVRVMSLRVTRTID